MEIKRKTEIRIQSKRRFVVRQSPSNEQIVCAECHASMLAAEAAAVLLDIKCRRVYQLVESGAAHFIETEAGRMFVCPSSLDAAIGKDKIAPIEIAGQITDSITS